MKIDKINELLEKTIFITRITGGILGNGKKKGKKNDLKVSFKDGTKID